VDIRVRNGAEGPIEISRANADGVFGARRHVVGGVISFVSGLPTFALLE